MRATETAEAAKPRTHRPRGADDLAILLPGGGARAAYQVGFLRWVSRHIPDAHFPIVTGVSAGAINAAFLASYRGTQTEAVDRLFDLWSNLTAERVFRTDGPSLGGLVVRWGLRLIAGGARLAPAVQGLVDTSPLRRTLADVFETRDGDITGIAENIAEGRLWALALLTSHYGTGQSVVWTQGRDLREWERPDRRSRNTALTLDHVLASSALPLFFPAVRLADGWHGDGGIRLTAPFSPALHLGANRILAVSTRFGASGTIDNANTRRHPPPMQIAGQLLDAVFLDDLDRDALELERINRLLREVAPQKAARHAADRAPRHTPVGGHLSTCRRVRGPTAPRFPPPGPRARLTGGQVARPAEPARFRARLSDPAHGARGERRGGERRPDTRSAAQQAGFALDRLTSRAPPLGLTGFSGPDRPDLTLEKAYQSTSIRMRSPSCRSSRICRRSARSGSAQRRPRSTRT